MGKQSTFTKASELKNAPTFNRRAVEETCSLCDGREPAISIGNQCLEALVETKLERMIAEGRFDEQLQKVLDRRLARASVPSADPEDHALVDELSGIIRD